MIETSEKIDNKFSEYHLIKVLGRTSIPNDDQNIFTDFEKIEMSLKMGQIENIAVKQNADNETYFIMIYQTDKTAVQAQFLIGMTIEKLKKYLEPLLDYTIEVH